MIDKVKEILERNNYTIKVSYNSETKVVRLYLPKRNQLPETNSHVIEYSFVDNLLYCVIDGETIDIQCPTYICRILIYIDIRKVCNFLNFDTSLLEFYADEVKITESEFFEAIWPKDMEYTKEIEEKEKPLKKIVSRAINAAIPFHESFRFEAKYLNVEEGYDLVFSYYFGDKDE